jgi:diguanylate cyclase (GGDEF)-like protein
MCVRDGLDTAYRPGGDEFALLVPNLPPDAALCLARRVRQHFVAANAHGTTASIGVAWLVPDLDRPPLATSLLARCDAALYRVKATGGNGEALASEHASIENEN